MTKIWASALASVFLGNAAFAGAPETIITPEPAIADMAQTVTNWSGFYGGGMYAPTTGEWETFNNSVSVGIWELDSDALGAFAGYNFQRGAFVFGGELAYSAGDASYVSTTGGSPSENYNTYIDAKARLGYAINNVLVYGVAGGTWATDTDQGFPAIDLNGFNYGLGAQMKLGGNMFAGVEYLIRDLAGDGFFAATDFELSTQSIALRLGWQF